MTPEIGDSYARLGAGKGVLLDCRIDLPRFPHDRPGIAEQSSEIKAARFRALIAAKDASILAHFSRADSGADVAPEIADSYSRLVPGKRIWSGG